MKAQSLEILEFPSLLGLVRRNAQTEPGRAQIEALGPLEEIGELQRQLQMVGECIELRRRGSRLSFDGVADCAESIARLRIAGTALEPLAILDLAHLCDRAVEARAAIMAERSECPILFEIVAALPNALKNLAAGLQRKILPNGELDDRASPKLAEIRRDINRTRTRIARSLENLMRRSSEAIQEELVTIRNDRFVIPVRSDHRGRINGVTHGSSSSGATVFIEPLETIEANNELHSLREAEQREIAEILFALSEELRRELPSIEIAAEAVTQLDFVNAKTIFAEKFNCVVPQVTEPGAVATGSKRVFEFIEARHPNVTEPGAVATGSKRVSELIDARHPNVTEPGAVATGSKRVFELIEARYPNATEPGAVATGSKMVFEFIEARHPLLEENLRNTTHIVVPVSFKLDDQDTTMVISGANAGGKTVVLKTAGLLSLMALSGLPVPARAARLPFYRSVLADIGDHQSLAANLSTFTSHVANIASMVDEHETPALVLLDEVGTGTDPEEGSALGVAVVDYFKQQGAHVLATTHYSGLKMYAANEPGVINASVEFDERTLRPTYRLLVGLAGSSSGLEIARRFGIPGNIISAASSQVNKSSLMAIEYLKRIKREAEEAEQLRRALEEERAAVAEKFTSIDHEAQRREIQRQRDFEATISRMLSDFEKQGRELLAKIDDRAVRAKVEREAEKRAAELKREAQRVAQEARRQDRPTPVSSTQSQTVGLPPQLRGVRVVRDGKVVSDGGERKKEVAASEPVLLSSEPESEFPLDKIKVGDRVRLLNFGSVGIVDRIKDEEAEVRVGSLHMRERLSNLTLVKGESQSATVRKPSLEDMRRRSATTEVHLQSTSGESRFRGGSELNLVGKKTDEAVDLADKFLDEAFLNGVTELRIIHGHGTGALRKAIVQLLTDHPHVARFNAAPQEQGGSGATIVSLRQ